MISEATAKSERGQDFGGFITNAEGMKGIHHRDTESAEKNFNTKARRHEGAIVDERPSAFGLLHFHYLGFRVSALIRIYSLSVGAV
jgi:hypothetical protein